MRLSRRLFLTASLTTLMGSALGGIRYMENDAQAGSKITPITRSDAEWRKLLSTEQYYVLRKEGTERPGSSPFNNEKRDGTYHCAGCALPLFEAKTKFESGTGWPSFYDFIPDALETKTDFWVGYPRTEYHCARCGGHQGHVFKDGPEPTGLRYCNNGIALKFKPAEAS